MRDSQFYHRNSQWFFTTLIGIVRTDYTLLQLKYFVQYIDVSIEFKGGEFELKALI